MRPRFLRAERMVGLDWGQLALLVWTVVLLVVCVRTAIQPRTRSLFYTWASAGSDWVHGRNLYVHEDWTDLDQFRYSPLVAASFAPLSLLNERLGNVVWRLFDAGVFLGGLWWWLRTVLPGSLTNSLKALIVLLVVPLALASLNNGQTNPLVIGFLLAATAALHDERWNLAALFITAACALKLYPIAVGALLVLVYPRQLSWRLALMLLGAALVPFCLRQPAYVLDQYQQWYRLLGTNTDRRYLPPELSITYRDLWLLFRVAGVPITPAVYLGIQLATAALCAALCGAANWLRVSKAKQLTAALMLGCCWMTLCGPATESSSFVQVAPALAWALVAARREEWPALVHWLPAVSLALFMAGVLAGLKWTATIHGLGVHPLGTLLLFVAYVGVTIQALIQAKKTGESGATTITAQAA